MLRKGSEACCDKREGKMRAGKLSVLMAAAVAICAASFPGSALADSLTGSVNVTWNLYEGSTPYNGSGQYNSQNPIAVNGVLSCPGSAIICGAFGDGRQPRLVSWNGYNHLRGYR